MLRRYFSKTVIMVILAVTGFYSSTQAQTATFRTTEGQTVSLSDLQGKIVVLSFGGTWVPLESKELPALQKISDRYSARGVKVFWVSINGSREGAKNFSSDANLQAFAQRSGFTQPVLRDPDQEAYKAFNLDAIPTVIIIDRQGNVVKKYVGFGTDPGESYSEISKVIEQLLK